MGSVSTIGYKVNGKQYDVPSGEVQAFLKDFPNAQKTVDYSVGDKIYAIPESDTTAFLKDFPNAKTQQNNLGYFGALAETLKPSSDPKAEQFQHDSDGKLMIGRSGLPLLTQEGAMKRLAPLEVASNAISLPSRHLYAGLSAAFGEKDFNEFMANKGELGELLLGEEGNVFGKIVLDIAGDPANYISGKGLLKLLGKAKNVGEGKKVLSAIEKINKSDFRGLKQKELEDIFNSPDAVKKITELERKISLDETVKAQEQGYKAGRQKTFEETFSPENINTQQTRLRVAEAESKSSDKINEIYRNKEKQELFDATKDYNIRRKEEAIKEGRLKEKVDDASVRNIEADMRAKDAAIANKNELERQQVFKEKKSLAGFSKGLVDAVTKDMASGGTLGSTFGGEYKFLNEYLNKVGLELSPDDIKRLRQGVSKIVSQSKLASEEKRIERVQKFVDNFKESKGFKDVFGSNKLVEDIAGKGKQAEPIIEKFVSGKSDDQIKSVLDNLSVKAREGDVNAALAKDMIKQRTGKSTSPFNSKPDPEKLGRGKLTKESPSKEILSQDQDKIKFFRGESVNMRDKAQALKGVTDDGVDNLYNETIDRVSKTTGRGGYTVDDLFVIGEKTIRNVDEIIKKSDVGEVDDILANYMSASTASGTLLRSIRDVNDEILKALRRGIGDDDFASIATKLGMKPKDFTPSFVDKFIEFSTMVKLTGISTHVKAVVGNGTTLFLKPIERFGAAALEAFKGSNRGVYAREALSEVYHSVGGLQSAFKKSWNVLKSEELALQEASKFGEVIANGGAIQGALGKVVRSPGRVIGAVDMFFKELNYTGEVAALATRKGLKEGFRGKELHEFVAKTIDNTPQEIITKAQKVAHERVFQEPIEGIANSINTIRRKHPLTRLIIPFWNTPVNLLKQSLQRTPLTAILPSTWKAFKKSAPGEVKSELISRAVTGSMFLTGAYIAGTNGYITGDLPKSKSKADVLRATGWQPNSLKFGDTYISYKGFEPLSSWIRVAGDMANGIKQNESELNLVKNFGVSYAKQFFENPFFMGIHGFTDIQRDFDKGNIPNVITDMVIGSTIPVILQQWGTRVWDPTVRAPKGAWERIKSRSPFGVSETISPLKDVFGKDIVRYSPVRQALGFTVSKANDNFVAKELVRLDIGVSRPSRKLNEIELSNDEYEKLQVLTGVMVEENLAKLMASPGYRDIPDDMKPRVIRNIMTTSRKIVKQKDFIKYWR